MLTVLQQSCRGNPAREQLLRDLLAFVEERGELTLLQKLPTSLNGNIIDWLRIYETVVALGGSDYLTQHNLWSTIIDKERLDMKPYKLAEYYKQYFYAFEMKQVFGRNYSIESLKTSGKRENSELIATSNELQTAKSVSSTPIPNSSKRLKVQRQTHADFGTLHQLVLALDSTIEEEGRRALNLLNILSFGSENSEDRDQMSHLQDSYIREYDLVIDKIPGLLDALYRQLQDCHLLMPFLSTSRSSRSSILNIDPAIGNREVCDHKALLVLNILRNLSMAWENETSIAKHEHLIVFLILVMREQDPQSEIWDYILDILCNVSKKIAFYELQPTVKDVQMVHHGLMSSNMLQYNQLAAILYKLESIFPLECLLQSIQKTLCMQDSNAIGHPLKRSVIIRLLELLSHIMRNPIMKVPLSSSPSLQSPDFLNQIVGFLATSSMDFAPEGRETQMEMEMLDEITQSEKSEWNPSRYDNKWPAPWERDGNGSGIGSGMGVVYVSPEGTNAQTNTTVYLHDEQLDLELRDAALDILFRLSDLDDQAKLRLGQHRNCLRRIAFILTSCIGRPEASRIAVATLCNISMNRATFPYFLPIEKHLNLVACSDHSVSDILNNVVADVYSMHSL